MNIFRTLLSAGAAIVLVFLCVAVALPVMFVSVAAPQLPFGWGEGVVAWMMGTPQPVGEDLPIYDGTPVYGTPGPPYIPPACQPDLTGPAGSGAFVWPTDRHYLSGYDWGDPVNYGTGHHIGLDLSTAMADPIYASDGGYVSLVVYGNQGYGNQIVLRHGNDWWSRYAHLSEVLVECGQAVTAGQLIGAAGSTGASTGPHLHFEIGHPVHSQAWSWSAGRVDPWRYLPAP